MFCKHQGSKKETKEFKANGKQKSIVIYMSNILIITLNVNDINTTIKRQSRMKTKDDPTIS